MNSMSREKLLVIIVAVLIGIFALDRLVVTPMIAGWKRRAEEMTRLRGSIERGESLIERESITRERWEQMRDRSLPKNASDAEKTVLEAFDKWSQESRIAVHSIRPQWRRGETDNYSLLECRVDAAGELGTLAEFLYAVEQSELPLRIESVEIVARDNAGRQLALALQVSALRLAPLELN